MGTLQVSIRDVDLWSFADIVNAYVSRENHKYDDNKTRWEQARFIAYFAAIGNLKKGTKMKDLITFEWEKVNKKVWSKKEIEELKKQGHPIFK